MPGLRVLAGPSPDSLVSITHLVNTDEPHSISTEHFEGQIAVNIKGFTTPEREVLDSEYFTREDRKDYTWSIQVQGRFLQPHSSDDILFGNIFDKPLNLPWGSSAVLKLMSYKDPSLEHDLTSPVKPWALSPLISTMPYLAHSRLRGSMASSRSSSYSSQDSGHFGEQHQSGAKNVSLPSFPPKSSITDNLRNVHILRSDSGSDLSSSSRSSSAASLSPSSYKKAKGSVTGKLKKKLSNVNLHMSDAISRSPSPRPPTQETSIKNLENAQQRRAHFHHVKHRKEVIFGPNDILAMDFCHGYLEFSPSLTLRIPGGVSFDLMRYWDGQPVRFVCCKRKEESDDTEGPYGQIFWCIQFELPTAGDEHALEEKGSEHESEGNRDLDNDID